jgi:hypothetical protein
MAALVAMPAADGSAWPLTDPPNEQKVGTDLVKAILDRYEKTVADLTALNALTGMFTGMRVWVTGVSRAYVYTGSGVGYGWQPAENVAYDTAAAQFIPISLAFTATATLSTAGDGSFVFSFGTTVKAAHRYAYAVSNSNVGANGAYFWGIARPTGDSAGLTVYYKNGAVGGSQWDVVLRYLYL